MRTPDPLDLARRLPRGCAVVYRHFGAAQAEAMARALLGIARARGLKVLIGQDEALARAVRADGVHLPEREFHRAAALRRAEPAWIVTSAAHGLRAARLSRADAVVISTAFPSQSSSAGRALGAVRLAGLVRATGRPAYALGGINNKTARRLLDAGLIGFAGVDGFGR